MHLDIHPAGLSNWLRPRNPINYQPDTLYGESKVRTEAIVRDSDGGGREWCLVRPTTVWGPGMSPHYQRLFMMIKRGRYFHVGRKLLRKSYSYVGNIAHQYRRLLEAPARACIGTRSILLTTFQSI